MQRNQQGNPPQRNYNQRNLPQWQGQNQSFQPNVHQYQQQICPPIQNQYQQQWQPYRQPNPVKRWKNWNYCWTHGYDVKDGHTSQTCTNPKIGHIFQATRQNPMGGSKKGITKTVLPA